MTSYFDVQEVLNVANSVSNDTRKVAWALLVVTTPIGYAVANARYSVDPRAPHPFRVLLSVVAVLFLLAFYQTIARFIDNTGRSFAAQISAGGNFEALLDAYTSDVEKKVDAEGASADDKSWFDKGAHLVSGWAQGVFSSIITLLGMFGVIVALHFYQIVQAVLYGVLVAVGPIVLAVAVLPGAWGMLSKWLTALFELAMWPIIGAVVFEMIGKALLRVYTNKSDDFIALFCANTVMILCLGLVPTIASRLVGSGFSGVSQMIAGSTSHAMRTVGSYTSTGAIMAAPHVGSAARTAASNAASAVGKAVVYQPQSPPLNEGIRETIRNHAERFKPI